MAETNLAATWDEIRRRISVKRGYSLDFKTWTAEQTSLMDDIIRSGYRLFLKPRPVGGPPHEWSFVKPPFDLLLLEGVQDVDLPSDFGFLCGHLYFVDDTVSRATPIQRVNDGAIRRMRQSQAITASQPTHCAILPNHGPTATKGQRNVLLLWPTPEQDYTVTGRYSLLPPALDITNPFPYGGAAHAETLIQACLCASEQINDTPGPATQHFAECLASSIEYDRRVKSQLIVNDDGTYNERYHRDQQQWPLPRGICTYNGMYST